MKIDFQHFKMWADIAHKDRIESDIRKDFADVIYKNANGVMALDIAMKIYKTEGPVEFSLDEMDFLSIFVKDTTPQFQDSFRDNQIE